MDSSSVIHESAIPETHFEDPIEEVDRDEKEEEEVVELNYPGNPRFPDVLRQEMEKDKSEDIYNYEYIWEGKIKKIDPKALWKRNMIKHLSEEERKEFSTHQLERIVVALDPSITSSTNSDACGIIVAGKFERENRYIILGDYTMVASPATWANKAIQLYQFMARCGY